MKLFFVFLLVAAVIADDALNEEECGCALGQYGDGSEAYECGYLCPSPPNYRCHINVKPCANAYDTCQLTASGYACTCTGTCTTCGATVCGTLCTDNALCPTGEECLADDAGVYACKVPVPVCTPTCEGKVCGADDGCGAKCATGTCKDKKDTCGGGGIEFVCGRKNKGRGMAWAWGLIGAILGCGACGGAAGIVIYKKKGSKKLVAQPVPAQANAMPEVETDPGTDA